LARPKKPRQGRPLLEFCLFQAISKVGRESFFLRKFLILLHFLNLKTLADDYSTIQIVRLVL
jgi:hypothetical protein